MSFIPCLTFTNLTLVKTDIDWTRHSLREAMTRALYLYLTVATWDSFRSGMSSRNVEHSPSRRTDSGERHLGPLPLTNKEKYQRISVP